MTYMQNLLSLLDHWLRIPCSPTPWTSMAYVASSSQECLWVVGAATFPRGEGQCRGSFIFHTLSCFMKRLKTLSTRNVYWLCNWNLGIMFSWISKAYILSRLGISFGYRGDIKGKFNKTFSFLGVKVLCEVVAYPDVPLPTMFFLRLIGVKAFSQSCHLLAQNARSLR